MNAQVDAEQAQKEKRVSKVDFKMVTFSLAGKDYGIDIMNIKEIAKAGKFTYVPNAAPFVRGVYNLRGDIISIIDLRIMFHLPAEKKAEDALESLLILRMDEHVFGVIVDSIDKVVGISREQLQPPHPIFGDVNIKYIRGIVEDHDRLYIILDISKIFKGKDAKDEEQVVARIDEEEVEERRDEAQKGAGVEDTAFVQDTLAAFLGFQATDINRFWLESRFREWKKLRKVEDLQLKDEEDAESFVSTFYSPYTSQFWADDYLTEMSRILPDFEAKTINVWNPGCGKGYETYSFACILKKRYADKRVKIWANDSDLLNISTAPNLVFDSADLPEFFADQVVKGRNGFSFNQSIRDTILFEYHDILNSTPLPDIDIILCRDLLSFLSVNDQKRVLDDFAERLKVNGIFISGQNETLIGVDGWTALPDTPIHAFTRSRE